MEKRSDYRPGLEVAVIGMAARFPGADNIDEFLNNLKNGMESIEVLSADELAKLNVDLKLVNDDRYVKARASLNNPDYFDAAFFGYSDEEAEIMDPQMRLLHECTWEALEHAGYDTEQYKGTVGLFVGGTPNQLWEAQTLFGEQEGILDAYSAGKLSKAYSKVLLHDKDLMSTRVAYKLNLKGPALTVFTSCSTSVVAVHLAVQSILSGESDMAVAGGVSVNFPKRAGYFYEEGMIVSSDGHCRTYDANANGTVFGDGIGLVILKRLENAIEDGDTIHAIIKGSAVNNDGSNRVGYMAPGIEGQAEVIKLAMQVAEVEPDSIAYIEGHGSATKVGDSIEIEAMKSAFRDVEGNNKIAIGSVKTNIGHLNSAAGAAGMIKSILSLKNRMLFPSLHCEEPNPVIENSCFYVNTELRGLEGNKYPLRAAVNSFGAGGTNANIVLEEPPVQQDGNKSTSPQLMVFSANTKSALETQTARFSAFLRDNSDADIADIAYTLKVGRRPLPFRKSFVAYDVNDAIRMLDGDIAGERALSSVKISGKKTNIVFMFSGQGAQYVDMGLELYKTYSVFREEADRCFNILYAQNGFDLRSIMYPSGDYESASRLNEIDIIQPAIFVLEYALAKLMLHLGVKPDILVGYSLGEVAAACIAGVFSLEDALKIVTTRGRLMRSTSDGMMLSVPMNAESIALEDGISVAIDNGSSCVVSGSKESIQAFNSKMMQQKILCIPVNSSHGAHSHLMEPVLEQFSQVLQECFLHEPKYPMISGITGMLLDNSEVIKPSYWISQMRETVRFAKGINGLLSEQDSIFIEIGPGRDLTVLVNSFINKISNENRRAFALDLVRIQGNKIADDYFILNRIGKLWQEGIRIDWNNYYANEKRRRIPLPTNPFEGKPYWPQSDSANVLVNKPAGKPVIGKESSVDDWFYVPSWKYMPLLRLEKDTGVHHTYLIFYTSQFDLENEIVSGIRSRGEKVVTVRPGNSFSSNKGEGFTINPLEYDDYVSLFEQLKLLNMLPDRIIDLWPASNNALLDMDPAEGFKKAQELGFYSLIKIVKALEQCSIDYNTEINIITYNLHEITGDECIVPVNATLLSTAKIISQEYPHINCRCIDIHEDSRNGQKAEMLARVLEDEFSLPASDRIVAYRGKQRWIQVFEPVKIEQNVTGSYLKQQGVYLITGGLGDIGFNLAKHLVNSYHAKVVLVGRSELSAENSHKLERLKALNDLGGTALYYSCDISDATQVTAIVEEVEKELGNINGVIHAAGVVGKDATAIKYMTKEICEEQFEAKVYGLIVLAKVFRERQLDFCLLTSSLSNILGGLGDTSYAAANAYMDCFVQTQKYIGNQYWLSVNWETWFLDKEQQSSSNLGKSRLVYSMKVEEGIDTFNRIMSCLQVNRILVSSGDIQRRMDMWLKLDETQTDTEKEAASNSVRTRPDLLSDYVQPVSSNERALVAVWERLLNVAKIGIKDDFFELGGDSLKAINMITRVRKEVGIQIPLSDFFKNPTIKAISEISEEGYEVTSLSAKTSIPKAEPSDSYVISPAQKRLYLIQEIAKESCLYNETQAFIIDGVIAYAKIEDVFRNIINRHEILRTIYQLTDDQYCQVVLEEHNFCISQLIIDDPSNLEAVVDGFRRPFELDKELPIRIGLGQIAEEKHLLIIDIHHIATDGASDNIIVSDFVRYYNQQDLPELKVQYKDYADWLNSIEQKEVKARQRKFWLDEFKSGHAVVNLPTDYKRPPIREEAGGQVTYKFNKDTTELLQAMAKQTNATLFIVLLSLFNLLMARLTGAEKVMVGIPVAGRRSLDLEDLIGIFVNLLAVQTEIDSDLTLEQFVLQFKEKMIQIYDNQEYPFEELIEELNVDRDPSRNPFIDIVFVMQSSDDFVTELADMNISKLTYQHKVAKYDLQCTAFLKGDEMELIFDYNASLFKESTIRRISKCFGQLAGQVQEKMNEKVSRLSLMTKEEESLCLITGGKETIVSSDDTIIQLFDEQAHRYASHVAVRYGKDEITYGELLINANKLANKLRKDGVGPGTVVALYLTPSIEMIIAIVATLKSGGAYLPIDPEYPEQRCRFMLQDSGSSCLLTQREMQHNHLFDSGNVYYVDDKSSYADESDQIEPINRSSDVAYIIYTSGTTGTPKGVMVEHRNLYSLFENTRSIFGFNEKDAWTLFHSYCFDFSVWEIWGALLFGGKLCVLSREERRDTRQFLKLLSSEKVTVLNQTPSAFYNLSEELVPDNTLLNIRYIIFGGEALAPAKLMKWSALYPEVKFINMYGITETTVHVTIKEITATIIENNTSSIGLPIPGMSAYILDGNGSLMPPGFFGELVVGGAGVTRGYLNRPDLTDKVFRKNMYSPAEKVFKTGDKARLTENGEIEYAGRIDRQVQLRGFRIELGEIEHHLLKIPGISDAVVIINKGNNQELHIIAYYVSDREYKAEDIKIILMKVLPDYMVPAFIIRIEEVPLTSNKKINYALLPDPKEAMDFEQVVAPSNEIEQKMLTQWSIVLELDKEKISVMKNFFDLGGNSLKIMHLNRLIREELKIDIPVVYLFKYTTIRSLVHFINSGEMSSGPNNHQKIENSLAEGKKRMENMLRRNRSI